MWVRPATLPRHGHAPTRTGEVKVTPIAGGIVTKIPRGPRRPACCARGRPLATIFQLRAGRRPQTRYLSMRAMLEADHKKLDRTETAWSSSGRREPGRELEEVTAVHVGHETEAGVGARPAGFLLLGLEPSWRSTALTDPSKVVSPVSWSPAPIGGVGDGNDRPIHRPGPSPMGAGFCFVRHRSRHRLAGRGISMSRNFRDDPRGLRSDGGPPAAYSRVRIFPRPA